MINPRRKKVIGIILTLVLVAALWVVILGYNLFSKLDIVQFTLNERSVTEKYEGVTNTIRELEEDFEKAYENFYARTQVKADLSAKALYEMVSLKGDDSITKLTNGSVVKIENGHITLPEGTRPGIEKYAQKIVGDKGTMLYDTVTMKGIRKDVLVYSHIKGPYYYVEIVNGNKLRDYVEWYVGYTDILSGMQMAYKLEFILICPEPEKSRFFFNTPGNLIYYRGCKIEEGLLNAEDVGMPSDLAGLTEMALSTDMVQNDVVSRITIEIKELDLVLMILVPGQNEVIQAVSETAVGILTITALCIVFLVWIVSVYGEMFNGTLTPEKKEKYSQDRLKLIAVSYGIIGVLIVFASSLFVRSLSNLYQETSDLNNSLLTLQVWGEQNKFEAEQEKTDKKSLYIDYAKRIAELLERYPDLNEKEELMQLSNIVDAAYIMLFDANGREVSTSSEYINMELGAEDAQNPSSTADFRRILKGVPSIAHDAVRDEVTGRKLELIGVRTNDLQNGGYGVLILAMKPGAEVDDKSGFDYIMKSLTPARKICFSVDPSTKVIENASNDQIRAYTTAEYLGLKDSALRGGVADFMKLAGVKYYIVSKADENTGKIYYFGSSTDILFQSGMRYALTCAVGFGGIFAILCLYLLWGYTQRSLEEAEKAEKKDFESKVPRIFAKTVSYLRYRLGNMTPEAKAFLTARILLTGFILKVYYDYRVSSAQVKEAFVFNYILEGKWNKGINLFSITAVVLLLCTIILGMFIVRFVLGTIGNTMNPRGKTICRLIANMIGYLAIIIFFYYALSYIGVDTNAILASVGVIGIGLTMGARDLIADIFAGISLIFEGEYQVGDIVSIDGYRGMVQEVGVRTTRIKGRGGNIKTIGNKDIKNVINLTKLNSWVPVTIRVDVNYPLLDVEAILSQTLPRIGAEHPEIISGPYYKGVLSVEAGFAVLSIIAECSEDNYHKVERATVREVLLALREKNVPVR